jgi:hypothetical protein
MSFNPAGSPEALSEALGLDILTMKVFEIHKIMGITFNVILVISFAVLIFFSVGAVMHQNIENIGKEQPQDATDIVKAAILAVLALFTYRFIFYFIISLFELISKAIFNLEESAVFTQTLVEYLAKEGEEISSTKSAMSFLLGSSSWKNGMLLLTVEVGAIIEKVILLIRYVVLSILYVLGPLCIAVSVWPPARKLVKSWFNTLFEFGAWLIVIRVIQIAFFALQAKNVFTDGLATYSMMFTLMIVYVLMMIMSYPITTKIMSGENMGMFMAAAAGAGSAMLARVPFANEMKDSVKGWFKGKALKGTSSDSANSGNSGNTRVSNPPPQQQKETPKRR